MKKKYKWDNPSEVVKRVRKWRKENPLKTKAQSIVFWAKRTGKLKVMPCEKCGKEKSEAHHEDYSKPLEVVWLCKKHHIEADKEKRKRDNK